MDPARTGFARADRNRTLISAVEVCMKLQRLIGFLLVALLGAVLGAGPTAAQMMGSLFQMAGGTDALGKLASGMLQSSASDPRLAGLLGKVDVKTLAPKLTDQMCSMVGGGCKAPLTDEQIKAGESKLDESQTKALSDNFASSLKNVTDNPLVKEGLSKAIAPKLGGIVGGLI
jgi:hypothetical protein